jgi:hypothetical protein
MAPDIDWELQNRGLAVLNAAASTFGEKRFASGQIQQAPRPTIHLYAVDPTQSEVTALDQAAEKAGYGLTVTSVRYSYAELLAFYEQLAGTDLPGNACTSYGFDVGTNALLFTLTRLDMDVVSYVLGHVPADAVRITIEPRAPRAFAMGR